MSNPYLAAAYAFVWMVFILYAWSLARRRTRVKEELEDLRRRLRESPPSESSSK